MQVVLIMPAVLFLTAVLVSNLPQQPEIAYGAQQIVTWYAVRLWTLWALLVTLPLIAVLTGCATLWQHYDKIAVAVEQPYTEPRTQAARHVITGSTVAAGLILVVVGLHILAN